MTIKIALAGNPNCGKTTLFNQLTGSNQYVGNWPGVTVEKKEGRLRGRKDVVIQDLPGIYSLSPYTLEEVVARGYLVGEKPDAILNIVDGTNIERNLYLTTQLIELGLPVVVAVNMMDLVRRNGDEIDLEKLRYGKVIVMADADVDGSHIRTLLLTFFFRFMRPLIEQGHIYLAQPPLFKLSRGKKVRYAYSDAQRDQYIAELGADGGKVDIQRYKGLGEMDAEQLWETTMDPERRTMIQVTMADAERADEIFTILMGDKVAPRREFIEQNAKFVNNLDI